MLEKMEFFLLYLRAQLKKRKYDDKIRQSADTNASIGISTSTNIDTNADIDISIKASADNNADTSTEGCAKN